MLPRLSDPSAPPLHCFFLAPALPPTQYCPQPVVPVIHLFSILPVTSLLSLRLVSKVCTRRIEDLLPKEVSFNYPSWSTGWNGLQERVPDQGEPRSPATLACISMHARTLYIHITFSPPDSSKPFFPVTNVLSPNLKTLYLSLPPVSKGTDGAQSDSRSTLDNSFQRLLTIRHALQAAYLHNLTTVTIENLTFLGIVALRWTPLGSFQPSAIEQQADDRMARPFWSNISTLSISLIPWWDTTLNLDHHQKALGNETNRDHYRDGIKILNDWLSSFAGTLTSLSLAWKIPRSHFLPTLPNPLLLDLFSTPPSGHTWYSAPPIRWRRLRSVVLGAGITVSSLDILEMNKRARHKLLTLTVGGKVINMKALLEVKVPRWDQEIDKIYNLTLRHVVPGKVPVPKSSSSSSSSSSSTFDDSKISVGVGVGVAGNARRMPSIDEEEERHSKSFSLRRNGEILHTGEAVF